MEFPSLSTEKEALLVESLEQWALSNSLIIYPPSFESYAPVVAPTTLFPTPFPKIAFQDANDVQISFNELYAKVSCDVPWLSSIIDELARFDTNFTGKLWDIYKKAEKIGIVQPLTLGIFRSDYMVNEVIGKKPQIKQIEFNTVSVSFGGLSSKVGELHQYLNNNGLYDVENSSKKYYKNDDLPISESIDAIANGIADGNYHYNKGVQTTKTVILVVIQDKERNVFDQRLLEYSLLKNHDIRSVRLSLSEIDTKIIMNEKTKKIYIKATGDEISVVYFRSGYAPTDFITEKHWDNRLTLETSYAIKAPNLLTQLAGAKKIQQILIDEQILSRFLKKKSQFEFNQVLNTFVQIYSLDDTEKGKFAKKLALEQPGNYVLKPQREGGGNNIYKEEIPLFLSKIPEKEWAGYILMELIHPRTHNNKILRNGEIFNEPIISELGRFGTILFDQSSAKILKNRNSGWLLRSKFESSNEGGVAAGFGCVDSVVLI